MIQLLFLNFRSPTNNKKMLKKYLRHEEPEKYLLERGAARLSY